MSLPTDDGLRMPAHLWLPASGTGPGLVFLQEIFGISGYVRRRAQDLADLGYVVLAPEIYWRMGDVGPFEGPDAMDRGLAAMSSIDWQSAVLDGACAVRHLRSLDDVTGGVGLIGFCFGGGLGFDVAAHLESPEGGGRGVDAFVSFYGSALPGLVDTRTVTAPSLHHFGLADQYIDDETVHRLEAVLTAQAGTTFLTYEGADHAFDNGDLPLHHPEASAQAWAVTQQWLEEHLPTPRAG